MDIERIRFETVELLKSQITREDKDDPFADIAELIIEYSSKVSKTMLDKYHKELSKSK